MDVVYRMIKYRRNGKVQFVSQFIRPFVISSNYNYKAMNFI